MQRVEDADGNEKDADYPDVPPDADVRGARREPDADVVDRRLDGQQDRKDGDDADLAGRRRDVRRVIEE